MEIQSLIACICVPPRFLRKLYLKEKLMSRTMTEFVLRHQISVGACGLLLVRPEQPEERE
jgi:hypothetical protein